MPFLDKAGGGISTGEDAFVPDAPEFFNEVLPAAFNLENTVGSAIHNGVNFQPDETVDANFDPISLIPAGHEDYADLYAYANTHDEVNKVAAQIDDELQMKRTIADAGGMGGLAILAAGVIDPINLIPIGGVAYKTYKASSSVLTGAMATAGAASAAMTVQEAGLHATQMTRTLGESALNIGAATVLGGVLGGTVGALSRTSKTIGGKSIDEITKAVEKDMDLDFVPTPISGVGAGKVLPDGVMSEVDKIWARTDISDADKPGLVADLLKKVEGIKGNKATDALLMAMSRQDPLMRTITSESTEVRKAVQGLSEIPLTLEKNSLGAATESSVESQIKGHRAGMYRSLIDLDNFYVNMIKGRNKRFGDIAAIGVKGIVSKPKMTYKEFKIEVGKAFRRGDTHEIPEVEKAAKAFRKNLYDPLKDEAIALKLLPEDVKVETAASYLNRSYNLEKLADPLSRQKFINKAEKWFRSERDAAIARLGKGEKSDKDSIFSKFDDDDLSDLAKTLVQRIEGHPAGRQPYDLTVPLVRKGGKAGSASSLKSRSFTIDDVEIEEWLENDIEILAKQHLHSLAPDIEIKRNFGDLEMSESIKAITAEWETLSKKGIKNWKKKRDRDINDLLAMRDRLRGTFSIPKDPNALAPRIGRGLRQLNYVRLLGGMTLSAIPDIARPLMVHGFANTYTDLIKPMITNFKAIKMAAQDLKDMGGAVELVMNTRILSIADLTDDFQRLSKFERGLGSMSDTFGIPSLMAPWNQAFKEIAGIMSMQRIHRAVKADVAGNIKNKELEFLRAAGVDKGKSQQILAQFNKHGGDENGMIMANWLEWDNKSAAKAFQQATIRDVDRIIVTPGQDLPLASSGQFGEMGRMMLQFKSFALSSMHRTLLAGLQQNDAAFWGGATMSMFLGMVVYATKETSAGRSLSDDPTKWVVEGIDRSGSTGVFMDANNMLEKVTRNTVGISALLGVDPNSRYISRNSVGAILGPSFGAASTIFGEAGRVADIANGKNEWEDRDSQALRRLAPYNNIFYFRRLVDKMVGK